MPINMSGPCVICGAKDYPLSMGGPAICPKCDCGTFDLATIQMQSKAMARLHAEIERLRVPHHPGSAHWLGDRDDADKTRHAVDAKGCVLYFDTEAECLAFMRWLVALPPADQQQGPKA